MPASPSIWAREKLRARADGFATDGAAPAVSEPARPCSSAISLPILYQSVYQNSALSTRRAPSHGQFPRKPAVRAPPSATDVSEGLGWPASEFVHLSGSNPPRRMGDWFDFSASPVISAVVVEARICLRAEVAVSQMLYCEHDGNAPNSPSPIDRRKAKRLTYPQGCKGAQALGSPHKKGRGGPSPWKSGPIGFPAARGIANPRLCI